MKKLSTFLLAFVACAGITQAAIVEGSCGDNLTWSFNTEDSTLTITGSGKMADWDYYDLPWYQHRSCIRYVALPDGLTNIGKGAFWVCRRLKSITIPNGVTDIGDFAFASCDDLASIEIPNSVVNIGRMACDSCRSLTSVTIPNSVKSIGDWAFASCEMLTSVSIGNSVTSIGECAFSGCTGLTSITNYATTPQSINSNVFGNVNKSTCVLNVPKESVSLYQAAEVWKEFTNIVGVDAPQAVDMVLSDKIPNTKIIRNGNVYILTDDKTYTIKGQTVK